MEELDDAMASGEKFTASSDAILQFFNDGHAVCFSWILSICGGI